MSSSPNAHQILHLDQILGFALLSWSRVLVLDSFCGSRFSAPLPAQSGKKILTSRRCSLKRGQHTLYLLATRLEKAWQLQIPTKSLDRLVDRAAVAT